MHATDVCCDAVVCNGPCYYKVALFVYVNNVMTILKYLSSYLIIVIYENDDEMNLPYYFKYYRHNMY